MGAIAEAIVAYAQPLIDETDGSVEQMNKAFSISQLCWNLALMAEDELDTALSEMRPTLKMDDEEFVAFRRIVIDPMIRRHHAMFPRINQRRSPSDWECDPAPPAYSNTAARGKKYTGTIDRYAPCPCNSGRKYKFCCGRKGD